MDAFSGFIKSLVPNPPLRPLTVHRHPISVLFLVPVSDLHNLSLPGVEPDAEYLLTIVQRKDPGTDKTRNSHQNINSLENTTKNKAMPMKT